MTKTLLIIAATVLNFQQPAGKLTGKWKLVQYKDLTTGITENEPGMYKDLDVMTFEFTDNDSSGTFIGKTVQNNTKGNYLLFPDNKMQVINFGGTKKGESEWGGRFWYTIREAGSYSINGDTLNLYYRNNLKSMVFIKKRVK